MNSAASQIFLGFSVCVLFVLTMGFTSGKPTDEGVRKVPVKVMLK